jgi:hypothetical protein
MLKETNTGHKTTLARLLVLMTVAVISLTACLPGAVEPPPPATEEATGTDDTELPTKKFKVLHIMSYHADWVWNVDQLNGFKQGLEGLDVEYKVFEMDTKRQDSEEWKEQVGQEARDLIDSWQPDLVYTNDDNAQEYVAKYYVNSDIPFVFSAVNAAPEEYGYAGSTGR